MLVFMDTAARLTVEAAKASAKKKFVLEAARSSWTRSTLTALSGK